MSLPFSTVTVLGAGTMGHGIAHVCALAGCEVSLYDVDGDRVEVGLSRIAAALARGVEKGRITEAEREAALVRLTGTTDLPHAVGEAELVVEAAPEDLALKRRIFAEVSAYAPPEAVLGTNTSSLSVASIAAAVAGPERFLGLHFFNPVPVMALLEVVRHEGTGAEVLEAARAFGAGIGKEVIVVRDSPGFATSRLGVALGMEAVRMLEEGVASAEDIDRAMVHGYRHPMGPLKLTDLIGLDVRLASGSYMARELRNPAFEPPELMRRMVAEGKLGQKAGQGFYRW